MPLDALPDAKVRLRMQAAGQAMEHLFPGRAFAVFILPATTDQHAVYLSNGDRPTVKKALMELHAEGLTALPPDDQHAN